MTPKDWAKEWILRVDLAGAEASPSEVVEVIVMRAVEEERERCALQAESHPQIHHGQGTCCGYDIACKLRE
jgi:hypothetical protein